MHLDDEKVQRFLHGELPSPMDTIVREHLASCAQCRARVAQAEKEEQELQALLRHLDHAPPPITAQEVARRAPAHWLRWGRLAAGIAVALGLGAAYAIPGSPFPAWVRAAAKWAGGRTDRSPSVPAPSPAPRPEPSSTLEPTVAGIAVAPGRELAISFSSARGSARVALTEGAEVVVRAPAGAALFTSHVNALVIDNVDSTATFDIEIPRDAPRVEIRVGRLRVFLKEGPTITTEAPPESGGSYVIPLISSGR